MISRVIWLACLAGLAFITAGVQLDRQARKTPEIASSVPGLFRSAAQPRIAAQAIESGPSRVGLAEARKLVRRRPMPARHLRLLAQAQFAAGDNETSALTIQYAAMRGWREPLAQEAKLQIALVVGDRSEAARRYAALFLMRGTNRNFLEETGRVVFPDPAGKEREVFAGIVSGGKRWQSAFMSQGASVIPPKAFVGIVDKAISNGSEFDCTAIKSAIRLLSRKDVSASGRLAELTNSRCVPSVSFPR